MTVEIARFTIPGEPKPKERPRVTVRRTYTPTSTKEYEAKVRAAWDAAPRPDMPECVRIDIFFLRSNRIRVDLDNLVKAVTDGLNKRAYADDWQIHDLRAQKFYTTKERARTEVVVYAIDGDREERF